MPKPSPARPEADLVPDVLRHTLLRSASIVSEFPAPEQPADGGVRCLEAEGPDFPQGLRIVVTDPTRHGGTFTAQNLRLLRAFLQQAGQTGQPLVMGQATGGVRITQPRTVFQDVFGAVADLFALRRQHPVITVAAGKALGLGALFFGQGHLRIAAGAETLINLTGPTVMQGYFGGGHEAFDRYASAGHQFEANHLIHEVTADLPAALERVRAVLRFQHAALPAEEVPGGLEAPAAAMLADLADAAMEVFPARSSRWRTYMCRLDGRLYGLLFQPFHNPDNMIGVAEVVRAREAVTLFRALGLPLVSAIDSPGGDPRQASSDADVVLRSLELAEALVSYPHPKLGLLLARCYGGVGLFALPRSHGSVGLLAVEGSRIGVMGDALIEGIIGPTSKLRAEWEETRRLHQPDMAEMLQTENLQGRVRRADLKAELRRWLLGG